MDDRFKISPKIWVKLWNHRSKLCHNVVKWCVLSSCPCIHSHWYLGSSQWADRCSYYLDQGVSELLDSLWWIWMHRCIRSQSVTSMPSAKSCLPTLVMCGRALSCTSRDTGQCLRSKARFGTRISSSHQVAVLTNLQDPFYFGSLPCNIKHLGPLFCKVALI